MTTHADPTHFDSIDTPNRKRPRLISALLEKLPRTKPDYAWPTSCQTQSKRLLDAIGFVAFYVAYALGRVVSLVAPNAPAALVIRTDGIGDMLLFEPALSAMSRQLSPRRLHVWAPAGSCELLAHCPYLHRSQVTPRGGKAGNLGLFASPAWRTRTGFALGRWKFDTVVYPAQSPEPLGNWLLTTARATHRWYHPGDTINQFEHQRDNTTRRATRKLKTATAHPHEIERNLAMLGGTSTVRHRKPKLYVGEAHLDHADALARRLNHQADECGATDLIAINVSASMSINSYPDAKWAETIRLLWDRSRAMSLLVRTPQSRRHVDELSRLLEGVPHLVMPKPEPLLTTAALLRRVNAVVTVDTSLAHLALTQRVPTVVLATGGYPGRFVPWPDVQQQAVLTVATECAGCQNRCTEASAHCVQDITPDRIFTATTRLLREQRVEAFVSPGVTKKLRQAV